MRSLSIVTLVGHVGRDPERRYTTKGDEVVSFSLAVSTKRGEAEEQTAWYTVSAFGGLAGVVRDYVKKGSPVFVQGQLLPRLFDGRDGRVHQALDVTARELLLLPSRDDTDAPVDLGSADAVAAGAEIDDAEMPF